MVSHPSQRWTSLDSGGGSETAEVASEKSAGVTCNASTVGDTRLGLLLSFLSPACKITHGFLRRGASPRKRWNLSGEVEEVGAISAGLVPELAGLLSDSPRLSNALDSLTPATLKKTDQGYMLDVEAVKRIHRGLTTEASAFWESQALIVSYRACPWKYIESKNLDLSLILPHLQYTAECHGDGLESLGSATRVDLILTILEASRFPTMAWKRSMISQADAAMKYVTSRHDEHYYLLLRLNSAKSLLHRLEGNHDNAVRGIDKLIDQQQQAPQNQRENAAMGHVALQRALNSMQVDDLTQAEQILDQWRHLGDDEPSSMEHIVYFRRGVTLGRILRALGRFAEAHTHLKRSYDLAAQQHDLFFDEDRRDLISELADTLLELDKPYAAEAYLRTEFARRSQGMEDPAKSGKSLLEAAMAEVLFAQGRVEEAEHVCSQAEARWDELMKLGKFRICIVRAKIHHSRSDHAAAIGYWDMALQQASKFPGTTGRTTRILVLSRRESRRALGLADIEGFERCTDRSTARGKPGGTIYWIAGMRHWENSTLGGSLGSDVTSN